MELETFPEASVRDNRGCRGTGGIGPAFVTNNIKRLLRAFGAHTWRGGRVVVGGGAAPRTEPSVCYVVLHLQTFPVCEPEVP